MLSPFLDGWVEQMDIQAGAELGQAQNKLGLEFTSVDCFVELVERIQFCRID